MRKDLYKKFVRTAMGPITALLLVFLAGLNLVNWYQVDQQTDRMLQMVLQEASSLPPVQGGPPPMPPWQEVLPPEIQAEIQAVARHRILTMLAFSTAGVALCWLVMLALVRLLARRSIAPIAANLEKQKQFVTNAGHELKTPLAVIQANTEALELHQGESKWTRNIKGQTARLSALMTDLLTLARLDETAALPPARPVDLSALAAGSAETFREVAARKGILLEERITPGVTAQGDRDHFLQLLSILLDNGVKYTAVPGTITLAVAREGSTPVLRVSNSPAILEGVDVDRLFDRFYRGDPARTQATGGSGIGLSAAQAIVRAWKGTITAQTEGETAHFTVRLPG